MPHKDPEKRRQYRESCRERDAEYCRRYHAEHRMEILERQRQYRDNHREELRTKGAAFARRFRANHPEAMVNHSACRRKLTHGVEISKEEWLMVMREYEWRCAYCGRVLTSDTRSVDHVVPLSLKGTHSRLNLVAACRPCNNSKKDRMPHEWLRSPIPVPAVAKKLWAITLVNLPLENVRW